METVKAARIQRDVVLVGGADARGYLQTQLTQDVESLEVGACAWSFLLEPKSEIVALLRVSRVDDTRFVLDTEPGFGSRIRERIDGFLFRMDVEFDEAVWDCLAIRGPGAEDLAVTAPVVMRSPWPGVEGVDVLGPELEELEDIEEMSIRALDALRIRLGWPAMADLGGKTTPAMTGIVDRTVSFTKGCYTGQEFVARVHYRNATPPRRLVQVGYHPCGKPEPGDAVVVDGEEVGTLTSVSACQPLAIAHLKRSVDVPSEATVRGAPVCLGDLPVRSATPAPGAKRPTRSTLTLS